MKALSKLKIGFIILAASLVLFLLAFFYYKSESRQIIKVKHEFLQAITNIKLEQLVKWRADRIDDAKFFPTINKIIKSTAELNADKNNKDAKQYFSSTLKRFKANEYFENIFITDVNGSILFTLDSNFNSIDQVQIEEIRSAVEKDSTIIGDFYFSKNNKTIYVNVISIIKDNSGIPIGATVQIVDPYKSLYPIIQSWPVSSKSAETLLFKKEDDHVVYLNDLRHKKNSALSLKIHTTKSDIVAVKAVLGARGIIEGKDYRGKDILAAVKTIPGTDWFMVSKVDKEEIYSELFYRAGVISLIALISILLISFAAFYVYKFQQSNAYKNLFLKEKELTETQEEYRTALYSIGDAVITTDIQGRIKQMNSVAEALTEWKEIEVRGKSLSVVFNVINEETNEPVENPVTRVLRAGVVVGLANHTLLIRKDGSKIPIADSGSPIKNSDGKITGVVLVFRDQTEEREKEKTLLESEEKYRKMTSSSPMGMHFYELKKNGDLVLIDSNPAADKILGIDHTQLQGKTIEQAFPALANTEVPQRYREAASKGILWATEQIAYKDEKIEGAFEVKAYQTKPYNMVAVFADITERKRFEESLKSSEEKYRMLVDFASDAFFQGDSNGNFIYVNNKAIDLTGYSREELLIMNMKDLFSKEILDKTPLRYDKLLAGETIKTERVVVKRDGKQILVEMTSKQMPDGTYQSFIRDISEIKRSEKELAASQERFSKAFTTSPDSININRLSDGVYITINKGFTKMTGYAEEEVIGKTSAEIQIWADIKYRNELVEKLKTSNVVDNFEAKFRMKNGLIKDGLMSASIIELNGIPHIISITRDITERKRAEEKLREGETQFRSLFENAADAIFIADAESGIIVNANQAATKLLNLPLEKIIGKHQKELHPQEIKEYGEASFQKHKLEVEEMNVANAIESIVLSSNGYQIPVEVIASKVLYQGKNCMMGIFRDITERKKAEKDLIESENRFSGAIAGTGAGLWDWDMVNDKVFFSKKWKDMLGYQDYEVENSFAGWKNLWHPDDVAMIEKALDDYLKMKTPVYEVIHRLKHKDGNWCWILTRGDIHKDSSGKPVRWIGTNIDITDQKKAEEQIALLAQMVSVAPSAITIISFEGKFLYANHRAAQMCGCSEEEYLSLNLNDIDAPDDVELIPSRMEELNRKGELNFEGRHRRKDGSTYPVQVYAKKIDWISKPAILSITTDVTDRNKAEEIIKSSEANLYSLINNRNESIWSIDKDYNYIVFNNYFAETYFTAYNQKLVKGINALDILTPELKAFWKPKYDLALSGQKTEFEFTYQQNNKLIYLQVFLNPIIADGIINGVSALSVDTTERKHAEESLKASERKLRQVIDLVPHFIFAKNIDGKFILANKAVADVYGTTAENLINKCDNDFNPNAEEVRHFIEDDKKVIESGVELSSFEETITDSKGATRYLKTTKIPFTASGINEPALLGISVDITEQKRADAVLQDIIDKNPMSIQILDLEGYTIQTNLAHTKLFCVKPPANYSMFSDAQLLKLGYQEVFENFKKGEIVYFPDTYYNVHNVDPSFPDRPVWIKAVGFPLNDIHGKPEYYVLMHENITERKLAEEALEKTKIHYQKLIENAPDGIVQISADGEFKYVSPSAKKIFGHPLNERVNERPDELTHPEDLPKVLGLISDLVNNPLIIPTIEYRFKDYNGNYLWIESTFTNLLNEPSVQAIVINFRDINFRKTVEAKLRTLSQAVEQSPVIIVITDLKGDIDYVNPKFTEVTGYRIDEIKGLNINILKSEEQDKVLFKNLWETILLGKTWRGEINNKRKNGKRYWEETVISPILDSDGNIINFISVGEDITERKKLLTEIISSEEKFRSIWENSVDAMRLVDEKGMIINVNDSYCNLFGLSKEKLIGNSFNVSYIITESDTSLNGFKERFKDGTILKKFETEINLLSGKVIWVELTNSFIEFEDKPTMLLSIIRDITDRKVMITELTNAKEKAEEMVRLKSYFFANMSHELRTPFVGILGFAEILKDTLQNSDEREYAEQILKSSKRLTDTLNKILNVTRLEFDKVDLNYKVFDVCQLIKSVEGFYHNSAKLNNTKISSVLQAESIIVKSDAKLLEDVLNNLVNNAVKFTQNGIIKLIAEKIVEDKKDYLVIKVEDNGIGIPEEKQSLVWQEFRQASEGMNRSFEGTGLGLTISKKYVEMLGGEISLESKENVGTVFTIKLPLNRHEIKESEPNDKITAPIKINAEKSKNIKHKILYVEDDMVALQFINIILKSTYEVETVFKASAALELTKREQYHAIMLDINLGSGMDGVQLMQKIREIDFYKNIPIVAVTAYAAQSDKTEFLAKGFTHYISKPFTKNELLSLLKDVFSA